VYAVPLIPFCLSFYSYRDQFENVNLNLRESPLQDESRIRHVKALRDSNDGSVFKGDLLNHTVYHHKFECEG